MEEMRENLKKKLVHRFENSTKNNFVKEKLL